MTRKKVISYDVNMEAGTITFNVVGAGSCILELEKTTEETRQAALYNGFKQAGGDKAAIPCDPKTGKAATPAEKFARVKAWVEHLNGGGSWELRSSKPTFNRAALFEAVAEVRGVSAEVVYAKLGAREDAVLQSFLVHREIAAVYARITARGDSGEVDALLEEIG